jgi:D-alanine-D-alanine ligase
MDKVAFKDLMALHGVPQVAYEAVRQGRDDIDRLQRLGLPVFVKPARLGSSVGIAKVDDPSQLQSALDSAFEHDDLVIVEAAATGLEVECSVIGNRDPIASEPGEIMLAAGEAGWYDYEAKYTPGGMQLIVPARVPDHVREQIKDVAIQAFLGADCYGLARVDFFVERDRVLLNELNTMPGFTSTSVYASLFEASGIPYAEVLDRLVQLALERHAAERRHRH